MATKRQKIGAYLSKIWRTVEGMLVEGDIESTTGFVYPVFAGALTDGAPTDAELDALIGSTPAAKGAGWSAIVSDTAGTALKYHVYSDGTSWLYSVSVAAA